jgi:hypothetical protein
MMNMGKTRIPIQLLSAAPRLSWMGTELLMRLVLRRGGIGMAV